MPPSIAVVGSINLDLVTTCDRLPRPGETIVGGEFQMVPGGKGANQAVAAARLGAVVRLVGAVGDDSFADLALADLRREGVDLSALARVPAPTGVAAILVDRDGENQIVVAPGANASVTLEGTDLGAPNAVLCQLEIPLETVAAAARETSGFFCLNAAPATPVPAEVLGRADLVVVNRYELDALAEMPRVVALTLGARGRGHPRGRGGGRPGGAASRRGGRRDGRRRRLHRLPRRLPARGPRPRGGAPARLRGGRDRRLAARGATLAPHRGRG